MGGRKRKINRTTDEAVHNPKKKPKPAATSSITRKTSNSQTITHFEDLANETIHDILDHLDAHDIYQSFFNLNRRFQNLLSYLNVPIKANISTFSKSTFHHYYTDFIRPIQHRTIAFHLSDPFIVEYIFPTTDDISMYSQLRTLHLENIESQHLEDLIHRLTVLPNLSSLIMHAGSGVNEINLYNQLLQFPALKYCELSFRRDVPLEALSISTNTSSPIEHLILHNHYSLNAIDAFLSNIPQLRRLVITSKWTKLIVLILFHNLRQCSFTSEGVDSGALEQFMKRYSHQIQLVHSCTIYSTYSDSAIVTIWKESILSYLPPVKSVYLKKVGEIICDHAFEIYSVLSPPYYFFGDKVKQCFFTHEAKSEENLHQILRSFGSYRRKYLIIRQSSESLCDVENVRHSVRSITIRDTTALSNISKSFPNVTELIVDSYRGTCSTLFTTDALRHTISVTHLRKLTFNNHFSNFDQVLDVLLYVPNINTLAIISISTTAREISTLRKSEKFRLISEQNQIKHLMICNYSMMTIKMLIDLCPELQHLSFNRHQTSFIEIARYLLSRDARKYSWISSFSSPLIPLDKKLAEKISTLVRSKKHIDDYSLKILENKLYLWWS